MKLVKAKETAIKPLFSWKTILGMGSCILACNFFSCMNALTKELYNSTNITPWELIYWRSLSLVVFNVITAQINDGSIMIIPRKFCFPLFLRVISGTVGIFFIFYQTKVMNFSKATAIFFIYPAFAMMFAYLLLKERITRYDIISSILSFIGVIVIVFDPNATKKVNDVEEEPIWAPIIPILASIFCAIADVYTRVLGSNVSCTVSPGYFGLGAALLSFILAQVNFSSTNIITNHNSKAVLYIIIISISGFLGQLLLTKAFQLEKAGRIAVLSYLQVVNACLIDIFIFRIPICGMQYFGIFIIVSSGGGLMMLKGFDIIK